MWQTHTNPPSSGQSQPCRLKVRCNLDKDVFCLAPNRMWRQNPLGRVAWTPTPSVNVSSVLLPPSAFSILFSTSMSILCRITHQQSPSCNGMGETPIATVTHYTLQVCVTHAATACLFVDWLEGVLLNKLYMHIIIIRVWNPSFTRV